MATPDINKILKSIEKYGIMPEFVSSLNLVQAVEYMKNHFDRVLPKIYRVDLGLADDDEVFKDFNNTRSIIRDSSFEKIYWASKEKRKKSNRKLALSQEKELVYTTRMDKGLERFVLGEYLDILRASVANSALVINTVNPIYGNNFFIDAQRMFQNEWFKDKVNEHNALIEQTRIDRVNQTTKSFGGKLGKNQESIDTLEKRIKYVDEFFRDYETSEMPFDNFVSLRYKDFKSRVSESGSGALFLQYEDLRLALADYRKEHKKSRKNDEYTQTTRKFMKLISALNSQLQESLDEDMNFFRGFFRFNLLQIDSRRYKLFADSSLLKEHIKKFGGIFYGDFNEQLIKSDENYRKLSNDYEMQKQKRDSSYPDLVKSRRKIKDYLKKEHKHLISDKLNDSDISNILDLIKKQDTFSPDDAVKEILINYYTCTKKHSALQTEFEKTRKQLTEYSLNNKVELFRAYKHDEFMKTLKNYHINKIKKMINTLNKYHSRIKERIYDLEEQVSENASEDIVSQKMNFSELVKFYIRALPDKNRILEQSRVLNKNRLETITLLAFDDSGNIYYHNLRGFDYSISKNMLQKTNRKIAAIVPSFMLLKYVDVSAPSNAKLLKLGDGSGDIRMYPSIILANDLYNRLLSDPIKGSVIISSEKSGEGFQYRVEGIVGAEKLDIQNIY